MFWICTWYGCYNMFSSTYRLSEYIRQVLYETYVQCFFMVNEKNIPLIPMDVAFKYDSHLKRLWKSYQNFPRYLNLFVAKLGT